MLDEGVIVMVVSGSISGLVVIEESSTSLQASVFLQSHRVDCCLLL